MYVLYMYIYGGITKGRITVNVYVACYEYVHICNSLVKSTVFCNFVENFLLRN